MLEMCKSIYVLVAQLLALSVGFYDDAVDFPHVESQHVVDKLRITLAGSSW